MPILDRVMHRFGYVRLARYGLVLSEDDRVVPIGTIAESLFVTAPVFRPTATRPAVMTARMPVAAVAAKPAEPAEDDDWEWVIAIARAQAAAFDAPAPATDTEEMLAVQIGEDTVVTRAAPPSIVATAPLRARGTGAPPIPSIASASARTLAPAPLATVRPLPSLAPVARRPLRAARSFA